MHANEKKYTLKDTFDIKDRSRAYCQNSNCPQKHRRFFKTSMIDDGSFIFCSQSCKEVVDGKNMVLMNSQ